MKLFSQNVIIMPIKIEVLPTQIPLRFLPNVSQKRHAIVLGLKYRTVGVTNNAIQVLEKIVMVLFITDLSPQSTFGVHITTVPEYK